MGRILIGADFGTYEVRVAAVDIKTGQMLGISSISYENGVLDKLLPNARVLPKNFALQNPADWLIALSQATRQLVMDTGIPQSEIISLGVSFTSCTAMPVDDGGMPLAQKPEFAENYHAWPKLWRHHACIPQAEKLTNIAQDRGEPFLEYCGGRVNPEWLWPKLLETIEQSPELTNHIGYYLESGDWIVWQLTGNQIRNQCAAGYKACWVEGMGYPSNEFFAHASIDLARIAEKQRGIPVVQPGRLAGRLLPEIAEQLMFPSGLPVAVAVIDAQVGVLGAGVHEPDVMVMVMDTSNVHLLMSPDEKVFPGFAGLVKDGILDGYWGYESGQPASGDIFDWFRNILAPIELFERAKDDDVDETVVLDRWLTETPIGSNGLTALDWWNGNRSVLMDSSLSGMICGFTLGTTPAQVFRAIAESQAFGTRKIIETYIANGLPIKRMVATGSLPFNYRSLLQIYADVCNIDITVPDTPHAIARGAAILGGLSVGVENLGFKNRNDYFTSMNPAVFDHYTPDTVAVEKYDKLYIKWNKLHDWFCGGNI
ncbi:MAG: ribulokinase [Caldisericia bacterium]|nr:ribulokinase [Caldisericia bacterium]